MATSTKATQPQPRPATSSSSRVSFPGLMENKGAAAAPEKEAQVPVASSTTCFKWTVGEGATLMERAKDQYRQFTEAQASEHWECIKNKVSSMFAEPIPFFGGGAAKDHGSSSGGSTPSPVESQ